MTEEVSKIQRKIPDKFTYFFFLSAFVRRTANMQYTECKFTVLSASKKNCEDGDQEATSPCDLRCQLP
jgi:hypothetical protein